MRSAPGPTRFSRQGRPPALSPARLRRRCRSRVARPGGGPGALRRPGGLRLVAPRRAWPARPGAASTVARGGQRVAVPLGRRGRDGPSGRPGDGPSRPPLLRSGPRLSPSPVGPWNTLRDWWRWRLGELEQPPVLPRDAARETSARACFQWGLLAKLQPIAGSTLTWLERARFLQPDNYWHQYALALHLEQAGEVEGALQHYEAAVALRPDGPMGLVQPRPPLCLSEGRLESRPPRPGPGGDGRGRPARGPGPLPDRAGQGPPGRRRRPGSPRRLRGGDRGRPRGPAAHATLGSTGLGCLPRPAPRRARAEYDALLDADPSDRTARLARARLAMRQGQAAEAEADLTRLLSERTDSAPKTRADWLASRALARLALGRVAEAEADAEEALRLDPSPSLDRIRARAALGAGRPIDDRLLHPDAIADWPVGGPSLMADLRAAIDRLGPARIGHGEADRRRGASCPRRDVQRPGRTRRRGLRGGSGRRSSPIRRVVCPPREIRLRAGDRVGALADVERGLAFDQDDPRLLTLRGRLAIAAWRTRRGPSLLDRAVFHGAAGLAHSWRAPAPDGPGSPRASRRGVVGCPGQRSRGCQCLSRPVPVPRQLGLWENALADLERAAERVPMARRSSLRSTLDVPRLPPR